MRRLRVGNLGVVVSVHRIFDAGPNLVQVVALTRTNARTRQELEDIPSHPRNEDFKRGLNDLGAKQEVGNDSTQREVGRTARPLGRTVCGSQLSTTGPRRWKHPLGSATHVGALPRQRELSLLVAGETNRYSPFVGHSYMHKDTCTYEEEDSVAVYFVVQKCDPTCGAPSGRERVA